jgi:small conductance mechanosensitive channel
MDEVQHYLGQMDLTGLTEDAVSVGMNAIYALIIALVALWLSGSMRRRIVRLSQRSETFDATLAKFLGSVVKYAILAFAAIFILGRFGIQTTSLAALIGAAGLAIGLALQGTLGNLAAGVLLVAFRPFKVGDFIEAAGHSGTVREISLFTTELATVDNVQIIIPNGDVFSSPIVNYSAHDTRRCDMVFGVAYDSDLKKTEQVLTGIVTGDARVFADPEPFIKVTNLGDSSVDFTVRAWCKAGDYWDLKFDLTRAVKDAFDEHGIDIPFPTSIEITRAA